MDLRGDQVYVILLPYLLQCWICDYNVQPGKTGINSTHLALQVHIDVIGFCYKEIYKILVIVIEISPRVSYKNT